MALEVKEEEFYFYLSKSSPPLRNSVMIIISLKLSKASINFTICGWEIFFSSWISHKTFCFWSLCLALKEFIKLLFNYATTYFTWYAWKQNTFPHLCFWHDRLFQTFLSHTLPFSCIYPHILHRELVLHHTLWRMNKYSITNYICTEFYSTW